MHTYIHTYMHCENTSSSGGQKSACNSCEIYLNAKKSKCIISPISSSIRFYDADQLAGSVIDMKPICTKCRPKSVIHKCIEDAHKLKVADVDDKERLTRLTNHFLNLKGE